VDCVDFDTTPDYLTLGWINFGKIRTFCIIGKQIFVPGVQVKSVLF